MALNQKLSVFVSSTSDDLHTYRAVAGQVILARGWYPIMNEYWGAMANPVLDACYEKIKSADLMLLIVAFRRGCVPTQEQGGNGLDSVTAWELDYARKNRIPVLPILANEKWPGTLFEKDQAGRDWVEKFRGAIHQPAAFFGPEDEVVGVKETDQLPLFRAKVGEVLLSYLQELVAREAKSPGCGGGAGLFRPRMQGNHRWNQHSIRGIGRIRRWLAQRSGAGESARDGRRLRRRMPGYGC